MFFLFYDQYEILCKKENKKPYTVAKEIGLGSSNVAQWKKGSTPRPDVLQKLSEYFSVSQAVLLGLDVDKEKSPTTEVAGLTKESIQMLLDRMSAEDLSALIADAASELAKRHAKK